MILNFLSKKEGIKASSISKIVVKTVSNITNMGKLTKNRCFLYARGFVPSKPLQPSLMFAGKARAYLSKAPFKCYTLG